MTENARDAAYLQDASEEAHIYWIILRGAAEQLLRTHVRQDHAHRCAAYLCHRPWPCIWRIRAQEALRRIQRGRTQ